VTTRPGQIGTPTPQATSGTPGTPGPTATPTEIVEILLYPGTNIRARARTAPAGATLILSAGMYGAADIKAGDLRGSITIMGDVTGDLTGGSAAPVIINAAASDTAMSIAQASDVTLDSLTFVGGKDAALRITDSDTITIFNCTMRNSAGDGMRVENTASGLFFNNLIYKNTGTGIRVLGSDDWFIINNTVYANKDSGLFAGISLNTPSSNLSIINNIFNTNMPTGIAVDAIPPSSLGGYFADFNLNSDGYGTDTPQGDNDVNGPGSESNPQFTFAKGSDDFTLTTTSPAVNAGDFDTDADLAAFLEERSTQSDGTLDTVPVDLGYHYSVEPTPTPRP
jgi:parallel beta-helix repeat protein